MATKKPVAQLPNNDDLNVLNSPKIKNRGIDSKNLSHIPRASNKSITDFNNGNGPTKIKIMPPIPQQFTDKKYHDENTYRRTLETENTSPKVSFKANEQPTKQSNQGSKS